MTRLRSSYLIKPPGFSVTRPASRYEPISLHPETERSLISRVGGGAVSGISAVGNLLDVPGSMIRDALAAENPFDQLLTPFQSVNRTTGRDLLQEFGALGRNRPGLDAGDVMGFLGEVALDPLTYLTLGSSAAVGAGGKIAKSAGLLDDVTTIAARKLGRPLGQVGRREAMMTTTLEDVMRYGGRDAVRKARDAAKKAGVNLRDVRGESLGGLAGVGLPFRNPSKVLDQGARSRRIARGLDKGGARLRYAKLPGTDLQPVNDLADLFNVKLKGAKTAIGQAAGRKLFSREEAVRASARSTIADYTNRVVKSGRVAPDDADRLRRVLEGAEPVPIGWESLHDDARAFLDDVPSQAAEWGVKINQYDDDKAKYFPRYLSEAIRRTFGRTAKPFSAFHPSQLKRKKWLKGIVGGTDTIKRLSKDPQLEALLSGGATVKQIAKWMGKHPTYKTLIPEKFEITIKGKPKMVNRRKPLAAWLGKLAPEALESGIYGNHPFADLQQYMLYVGDSIAAAKTVLETLAQPGVLKIPGRTARGAIADAPARAGGRVKIGSMLKSLDINVGTEQEGAIAKIAELMGAAMNKQTFAELSKATVPLELAEDIGRLLKGIQGPETAGRVIQAIDSATNLFKGFVTSPWPAFHTRNLLSGQFQNWVSGTFSGESVKAAHDLMRGKTVKGAAKIPEVKRIMRERGLAATDQAATEVLRELAYSHSIVGRFEGVAQATVGKTSGMAGSSLEDLLAGQPGAVPFSFNEVGQKLVGKHADTNLNPLNVRGVGGQMETSFGPLAAGEDLGHYIEGLNRLSPFIKQLHEGIDPGAAAAKVGAVQVLYSNRYYSQLENQALKRIFPFYSFSSRVMPSTLRLLYENPGGKLAQTIRGTNRGRGQDELTPDYVAETTSIPLGETDDGGKRFMTGLGLMWEDPLSFGGGGVGGALLEAGSRLNPLLKAPLEWMTQQSFFQKGPMGGRPIEDLDPTIGRTLANLAGREDPVETPRSLEFVLGNSPLARMLTTARTLTDTRKNPLEKAVNLGTGVRISNVSPGAQDALLRERATDTMKKAGAKSFERIYFSRDELEKMPPGEQLEALRMQALMNTLAKRAKDRKAAKEKAMNH